jgi:hypothetical protein
MFFSSAVDAIGVYRIAERHEDICARPEVGSRSRIRHG